MASWRAVALEEKQDSFMKMAAEEAIMNSVRKREAPPTLRFYSWDRPAVALGYFQQADIELNIELCKKEGVEIFRRITGGGAVYKSPEFELNYSFVIREDEPGIPKDVEESYRLLCGAVIEGLKILGFAAEFKPINDIMLLGKKVSGNAQTRVDNVLLHHGTILLKPEVDKMFRYLKIDDKKLLEKKVKSVKELVTGLNETGERQVSKEEIVAAVTQGFSKTFDREFALSELSPAEEEDAKRLYSKYADEKFVFWR